MRVPANSTVRPKILFVQPPFYRLFGSRFALNKYPLGLAYLAGVVLDQTSWDAAVYNADFHPAGRQPARVRDLTGPGFRSYQASLQDCSAAIWAEVRGKLAEHMPDVVGITATTPTFAPARIVAALAKEINPDCVVVCGGPHASIVGARILDDPSIDVAVHGEGEQTIVELLRGLEIGAGLLGIHGTSIRHESRIVRQSARAYLPDLDALCIPHEIAPRVLVDCEKYPRTSFRSIFATRGCPFHCLFCGSREVWSRRPRLRSPASVVREIQGLQRLGLKRIQFEDDTFGTSREHIRDLCRAIRRDCPGIQWSCEIHANLVDADTVSQMKSAGCHCIAVGVESGSNEILRQMRKGTTLERSLEACRLIRAAGVELMAFFLVGYPQETEASLAATVRAMRATGADELCYSIFTPYPHTEAWEVCRQKGLVSDDCDVSLYNHQSPENHFCAEIAPARFRTLAARIERLVDRHNAWRRWGVKWKRLMRRFSGRNHPMVVARDMQSTSDHSRQRSGLRS
jgi:pyruvate-formate lyase-activating enzyme